MKSAAFAYAQPHSAAEALRLLAGSDGGTKVCGGSQSLGPMLNLRLAQVDTLVDVSRLDALCAFELRGDVLHIGAAVTHALIEDGALPDVTRGLLPSVAANIAYRAVRNRGTLGGSLAHADPKADWVSTMCLLDATLLLVGPRGERRLPASAFFLGPFTTALTAEELLVAVEVPCFSPQARWAYRKNCRKPGEFASAIAAVWIDPARDVARVLVGALDGMPQLRIGAAALAALHHPGGIDEWLGELGLADAYEHEVQAAMLRRALKDIEAL